jgi:hypothetical protein
MSSVSVIFSTGKEEETEGTNATNFFKANFSYSIVFEVLARSMTSSMMILLSVFLTRICYDIRL